jgi:hypothetical protein
MKKCSKCEEYKVLAEFGRCKSSKDGKHHLCSVCNKLLSKKWQQKNPEKFKESKAKYRKKFQEKQKSYNLKYRFGISIEEYKELVTKQENKCAICGVVQTNRKLAVDHCHDSEAIRGLLCTNCNIGLGFFKDNEERLLKAVKYLRAAKNG